MFDRSFSGKELARSLACPSVRSFARSSVRLFISIPFHSDHFYIWSILRSHIRLFVQSFLRFSFLFIFGRFQDSFQSKMFQGFLPSVFVLRTAHFLLSLFDLPYGPLLCDFFVNRLPTPFYSVRFVSNIRRSVVSFFSFVYYLLSISKGSYMFKIAQKEDR